MNQDQIKEIFEYCDGGLYWKNDRVSVRIHSKKGTRAGNRNSSKKPYRRITIGKKSYLEHRLIWIYHYGDIPQNMVIDHINQIKYDNRIENLRLATLSLNRSNNSCTNVLFNKKAKVKKYISSVKYNGKLLQKSFDNYDDAKKHSEEIKKALFFGE